MDDNDWGVCARGQPSEIHRIVWHSNRLRETVAPALAAEKAGESANEKKGVVTNTRLFVVEQTRETLL